PSASWRGRRKPTAFSTRAAGSASAARAREVHEARPTRAAAWMLRSKKSRRFKWLMVHRPRWEEDQGTPMHGQCEWREQAASNRGPAGLQEPQGLGPAGPERGPERGEQAEAYCHREAHCQLGPGDDERRDLAPPNVDVSRHARAAVAG